MTAGFSFSQLLVDRQRRAELGLGLRRLARHEQHVAEVEVAARQAAAETRATAGFSSASF